MARVAPFRGLRYNQEKIDTLESVVSPPYDVIDQQAQNALSQKHPHNMIHLDLMKSVNVESLTDARYEKAKETFESWQQQSILIRDPQPAMYLYYTEYRIPSGEKRIRKGLLALAGLAEFSEGIVKPHEKTFRGVTTDRLRLIDACQAHFSPIFSLYSDPQGEILALLESARPLTPLCSVSDQDGCIHTIWAVTETQALARIQEIFAAKALYIADGHHRYTTSLQLRALMRERLGTVGPESPYDYTMMYLCGMEDEGLSVLPTHRLVRIPTPTAADQLVAQLEQGFVVEEIAGGSREVLVSEVLARMDENEKGTVFGLYHPSEDRCFLLTLIDGVMKEKCSGKQPETLQRLDVVVLSDLVLESLLGLSHAQCEEQGLISYYPDPDEALDKAVKESAATDMEPVLFLMNPTLVEQVRQVADENLIMPHKSTYFYPKALTGLLLNKLVPEEKIQ